MDTSVVILTSSSISCPGWIFAKLRHYTVQYATTNSRPDDDELNLGKIRIKAKLQYI